MTAPYIPFDPLDPYGLRKPFDPALLNALRQPAVSTAAGPAPAAPVPTIGPTAPHNMPGAMEDFGTDSDLLRLLKEIGVGFDERLTRDLKGTPISLLYGLGKGLVQQTAKDVSTIAKVPLREAGLAEPLAPGESSGLDEAAINMVGLLYPIGGTAQMSPAAVKAAEASHRTTVRRLLKPGGATMTPDGRHFMGSGYMVADPKFTVYNLKGEGEVGAFLRRSDVQKRLREGAMVGKWTDPKTGYTEINVSDPIESLDEAMMLARQRGEQAIGQIERGEYKGSIKNPTADPVVGSLTKPTPKPTIAPVDPMTGQPLKIAGRAPGSRSAQHEARLGSELRPPTEYQGSRAQPNVSQPDKIVAAAMRDPSGRIEAGALHSDARDALRAAGVTGMLERGYMTRSGEFVTEKEARAQGILSSKDIGRQEVPISPTARIAGEISADVSPSRIVAQDLIKEDAINRVKQLKGEGARAEIRQQPDGKWQVVRKGEPQEPPKPSTAVAKAEPWKEMRKQAEELRAEHSRLAGQQKEIYTEYWIDDPAAPESVERNAQGLVPYHSSSRYQQLDKQREDMWNKIQELEKQADDLEMAQPPKGVGHKGQPLGEGPFQSRVYTTLEYNQSGTKRATPEQWYAILKNDPNVPKSELDAIYNGRKPADFEEQLATMQKRYDEIMAWRNDPANHPPPWDRAYGDPEATAKREQWHRSQMEAERLFDEMRELQARDDWGDYLDKDGKISHERMMELVADKSPVGALEVRVQSADEGSYGREMTHDDIRAEMDNIIEVRSEEVKEELKTKVADAASEREQALKDARTALAVIVGEDKADDFMDNLISNYGLDDDPMSVDNHTLSELADEGWGEELWSEIDALKPADAPPVPLDDPLQVPLFGHLRPPPSGDELRYVELQQERARLEALYNNAGQGDNPPLYGHEYNRVTQRMSAIEKELLEVEDRLTDAKPLGERKFMPRQWEEFRKAMVRAESADREGSKAAFNFDNFDPEEYFAGRQMDQIEREAIENLEETGEFGDGDLETEFHQYQRVDEQAPYREVLIHQRGAGISGGHFNESDDLVAHARGEVHDDTWVMIESQSDFAQRLRGEAPPHVPFADTERWAQLSTGGSLTQAAAEGSEYFAWVSPENRMRRANLAREAAEITYGKAVPKAVQRIFKWLDIPMKVEPWGPGHRVRLTKQARDRILKAGIPALGLVGVAGLETRKRD